MIKVVLVFLTVISTFIYCDARQDCYEKSNRINSGFCELISVLTYQDINSTHRELTTDHMVKLFILCQKQEQDRKTCDSKSQYWPLPKNFNQGKDRGL